MGKRRAKHGFPTCTLEYCSSCFSTSDQYVAVKFWPVKLNGGKSKIWCNTAGAWLEARTYVQFRQFVKSWFLWQTGGLEPPANRRWGTRWHCWNPASTWIGMASGQASLSSQVRYGYMYIHIYIISIVLYNMYLYYIHTNAYMMGDNGIYNWYKHINKQEFLGLRPQDRQQKSYPDPLGAYVLGIVNTALERLKAGESLARVNHMCTLNATTNVYVCLCNIDNPAS